MTSDWVGNRLLLVFGQALYQLVLDDFTETSSSLGPKKLFNLTTGATDAKQLTFDPFKNTAYLLTKNGSLFSLNLSRGHERNLASAVRCLTNQTVTWMTTEFAWNRPSSPKIYALTWNGLVVIDVEENNKCNEVRIDWEKFGDRSCFILPSSAGIQFTVANNGKTGAVVEMSKPPPPNICHGISLPQTRYDVSSFS
ncbi:unnamed protein product [Cylicostephanus goldi]|uniref:Vps16 N-terminal domain-containing protein n=1 Tax=Cylicostephanus goldi TaxID=71465 RepID=A0A3P6S747_CYLGO|nr:unnamed protein product [Cylicostephanus goldi]